MLLTLTIYFVGACGFFISDNSVRAPMSWLNNFNFFRWLFLGLIKNELNHPKGRLCHEFIDNNLGEYLVSQYIVIIWVQIIVIKLVGLLLFVLKYRKYYIQ